ncbi:MAG: hypothetical protein WCJ33_02810 [Pseudomonadota bacterium]
MQLSISKGSKYSLILHVTLLLLLIFDLPDFMKRKPDEEPIAISVDILPISPKSNVKPQESTPEVKPDKKPVEEKVEEKKPTPETTKAEEKHEEKPVKVSAKEMVKPEEAIIPDKTKELKPEVKKTEVKPEKKPEKKKEDDLDSILKSVKETAKSEQSEKPKEHVATEKKSKAVSQNYDETAPLSMSEKDAIISQIQKCWNVPAGAKDINNLIVNLHIELSEDGSVTKVEMAKDEGRYNSDTFFRAAADSAMRAVRKCSPLKNLPVDKYGSWREMDLGFNPKDMF